MTTILNGLSGMPVALHGFIVGYEPIRESISLHGGSDHRYLLEPVTAAAVEYEDGWVLLDAGFNVPVIRDPRLRGETFNYDSYTAVVPPGDPLAEAVESAGLDWGDLRGCAISHAHVDHTGGIRLTGEAPVVVQRREWQWVVDGAGFPEVVLPSDLLEARERVVLLDGDAPLAPGLTAIDTAGHTPGHQSFRVELPSGTVVVLACDAADLRVNIDTRTPCGSADASEGFALAQRSIDRLADLAAAGEDVWPGHDPAWGPWVTAIETGLVTVR
ncbi:MAG: N-acyl homoserine lactonase family protein [Demequina sp.]|uniref:N-acyl homoserine lactonase family protein n=1 Tax=Demequina sp. TaxID=2050685 RepID=UPI003A83AFD6